MIQLSELTKSFGDRVLFDHVTWQITDRERVGLCGPNGAGKTTLLRMMAGLDEPDSGAVLKPSALTVGYLPQDGLTHSGRTVFDEAASAFGGLLAMKTEMHALEEQLGDESIPESQHEQMLVRYADLQEQFRHGDGYSIEVKTSAVLEGLVKTTDFTRETDTFSGGWQMRIALARLLLGQPGLLLLDEPTNHLDLEARNWLEEYLNGYPHAVILVSHDRYFLDAVVTRIADLTLRTLTDYVGTYSDYVVEHRASAMRGEREQDGSRPGNVNRSARAGPRSRAVQSGSNTRQSRAHPAPPRRAPLSVSLVRRAAGPCPRAQARAQGLWRFSGLRSWTCTSNAATASRYG